MSSPTPIITPKPKTQTTIAPTGLRSPKDVAKEYSTWAWGFVAALPDLYAQVLSLGPVPDRFSVALWAVAAFGVAAKFIKQRRES